MNSQIFYRKNSLQTMDGRKNNYLDQEIPIQYTPNNKKPQKTENQQSIKNKSLSFKNKIFYSVLNRINFFQYKSQKKDKVKQEVSSLFNQEFQSTDKLPKISLTQLQNQNSQLKNKLNQSLFESRIIQASPNLKCDESIQQESQSINMKTQDLVKSNVVKNYKNYLQGLTQSHKELNIIRDESRTTIDDNQSIQLNEGQQSLQNHKFKFIIKKQLTQRTPYKLESQNSLTVL